MFYIKLAAAFFGALISGDSEPSETERADEEAGIIALSREVRGQRW